MASGRVSIVDRTEESDRLPQAVGRSRQFAPILIGIRFSGRPQKEVTRVVNLPRDDRLGDGCAFLGGIGSAELLAAKKDVSRARRIDSGNEPPAGSQKGYCHIVISTESHCRRGHIDTTKCGKTIDLMDGYGEFGLPFNDHFQCQVVPSHGRLAGDHEQRIELNFHGVTHLEHRKGPLRLERIQSGQR
jgi:hypothetical protein